MATITPIGLGLGLGVLIDAFVVRILVIPAAMTLLGEAAWWLPEGLTKILPNVDVEGGQLEQETPTEVRSLAREQRKKATP